MIGASTPPALQKRTTVLFITPPLVQCNSPYSAGPRLAGFLRSRRIAAAQWDASLDLILSLMSAEGLRRVAVALRTARHVGYSSRFFLRNMRQYIATVEPAIAFLQGRQPSLATRILSRRFLPEGPRFSVIAEMGKSINCANTASTDVLEFFFAGDKQAAARYLASLFIDDIADAIREGIDERFGLSRFAEELVLGAESFDEIRDALEGPGTLIDSLIDEGTNRALARFQPSLLAISIPFPGAFYGAFKIARRARAILPDVRIVIGGGFVTRQLRSVKDPRLFDYVDHVVYDSGELPLLAIVQTLRGKRQPLIRTLVSRGKKVLYKAGASQPAPPPDAAPLDYTGLDLRKYILLAETPNPMIRMWTEGPWIKLSLADGCYWARCAFCDTTLRSVKCFKPAQAERIARRMREAISCTRWPGIHFTDEAAPPNLLRKLSLHLTQHGPISKWWVNIRFEPSFTPALAKLMAKAGCVAVTGGLEAANDRLLRLLSKGITVATAARVMSAFRDAGIMVHAYLMYGCPTQTTQETVDALEIVRQLFENRCLVSCHWHRFALAPFSPIAMKPKRYGIRNVHTAVKTFVCDHLSYRDSVRCDHDMLGRGLKKAAYNYMLGLGLDMDVRRWFEKPVPAPTIPPDAILRMI